LVSLYPQYGYINILTDFYSLPDAPSQYEHRAISVFLWYLQ
jgi:hypothetical protein